VYYNHKLMGDAPYYDLPGSAQYPFGYGLSYTSFSLANLRLSVEQATVAALNAGGTVTVTVDVTNTGQRAGAETVQLYLHGIESSITRRVRELKQFAKVMLQPGERRTLTFPLGREELAVWGPDMQFAVDAGLNEIMVQGGDGHALTGRFRVH
jgi:beta-glucosidase